MLRLQKEAGTCEWFALCNRPAAVLVSHPVLAPVPTCIRCASRFGLDGPRISGSEIRAMMESTYRVEVTRTDGSVVVIGVRAYTRHEAEGRAMQEVAKSQDSEPWPYSALVVEGLPDGCCSG